MAFPINASRHSHPLLSLALPPMPYVTFCGDHLAFALSPTADGEVRMGEGHVLGGGLELNMPFNPCPTYAHNRWSAALPTRRTDGSGIGAGSPA